MARRDLNLAEPPKWVVMYPQCSACEQDLETDGDGWLCLSCGAVWNMRASDGDTGVLPGDAEGPVVRNKDAWRFSMPHLSPDERDQHIRKFYGTEAAS